MTLAAPAVGADRAAAMQRRLERVLAVHFDPEDGSRFWLDRARSLGVDPRRELRTLDDLARLGETSVDDLRGRALDDLLPRSVLRAGDLVVAQTGGTTGEGIWTAYRRDEFEAAFVAPFAAAAAHAGFPRGGRWLYVGPSGPHVIGKAAARLAEATGAIEPFAVDFDPRWAKRLAEGSFAQRRYLSHVVEQALAIVVQQGADVLFSTPPVLAALAEGMTDRQRGRIAGVHYGGMAVDAAEIEAVHRPAFPNAVHLSGYGNTLFGCCLELAADGRAGMDYFPHGDRLVLETVDDDGAPVAPGAVGRVRFTRLDESMLIVRMRERDEAVAVAPPAGAPSGFGPGVRDPRPALVHVPEQPRGIY